MPKPSGRSALPPGPGSTAEESWLLEDFPVADISEHLRDGDAVVWLDLCKPTSHDIAVIGEQFGLQALAVEDAVVERQRPKLDRYASHLFLSAYAVGLDPATAILQVSELAVFCTPSALITVHKAEGFDMDGVLARWDAFPRPGRPRRGLPAVRAARPHRRRAFHGRADP